MKAIRLQKALADAGVASRRKAELLIAQGKVTVNGRKIVEQGVKVSPGHDEIRLQGKQIVFRQAPVVLMLHKPPGVVATAQDERGRRSVVDMIPKRFGRVFPVGRLDRETTGLLLLTNDGDLTAKLTHPRYEVWKRYEVVVKGQPTSATLQKLQKGIRIDRKKTAPARVKLVSGSNQKSSLIFEIHEGRKRQIRRMCEAVHHPTVKLKRVAVGPLQLGSLPTGHWRELTNHELKRLREVTS